MKKHYLAMAVAAATLTLGTGQAAASDFYANGQLAIANAKNLDNGMALAMTFGMKQDNLLENLAFEAELTTSIDNPSKSYSYSYMGGTETYKVEVSYFSLGAYGVYSFPLNDMISLRGRAGLLYLDAEAKSSWSATYGGQTYSESAKASDSEINLSLGFGAVFNITDQLGVVTEFTMIDGSDLTHLGAGVQFRF